MSPCLRGASLLLLVAAAARGQEDELPARARLALRRATGYLVESVAVDGGYPARVDAAGRRWGERELGPDEIAVADPATPAIGLLCLEAHEVSGDRFYLAAALAAARALARCQLHSGGWDRVGQPAGCGAWYTRQAAARSEPAGGRDDTSRLEGRSTVAALRLLLRVAALTDDVEVRTAADYGLRALLNAQLTNGGWPAELPLPEGPGRLATLAGGVTPGIIELLAEAGERGRAEALTAAVAGGDCLLLARLTDPPAWPAAATGTLLPEPAGPDLSATLAACDALLRLHQATGDGRWLEPLSLVIDWLVDHPGDRAPAVDELRAAWRQHGQREPSREELARRTADRAPRVAAVIASLDEAGRWLTDGELVIGAAVDNLALLVTWLREYEPLPDWLGPRDTGRPPQHRRP